MNRVITGLGVGLALLASACTTGRADISPEARRLTAYGAWGEARSQARGWAPDAELQYVEGAAVNNQGAVLSDAGYWRFVYVADSRTQQYVVTVTPTSVDGAERAPQGPPGFVLRQGASLGTDWIDSPRVVDALDSFGADTRVQMFLVPTDPPRWIVGDVEIDARTGAVLD